MTPPLRMTAMRSLTSTLMPGTKSLVNALTSGMSVPQSRAWAEVHTRDGMKTRAASSPPHSLFRHGTPAFMGSGGGERQSGHGTLTWQLGGHLVGTAKGVLTVWSKSPIV